MYQRQEIVVKKNVQLMARYADALELSADAGMSETEEEQFMKSRFTEAEMGMIRATENAHTYLNVMVQYYLDILGLFEKFRYETYGELQPYVTFKTERDETEDEIRVVIEEFWNNCFELECTNPLMEDGFKGWVDYDQVPKAVRFLYNGIAQHEFLQKEYAEHHELFGESLCYNCIARYCDELENGESAIGIFNHGTKTYDRYGFGIADHGWTGKILTDHVIDRSVLAQNPDKIWHAVDPCLWWNSLDDESGLLSDAVAEMFDNLPPAFGEDVQERHDWGSFSDGTAMAYTYYMNRLRSQEVPEFAGSCKYTMTGAEILTLLDDLEHANKVFIEAQKKLCEAQSVDYINFGNENFCTLLLFHSDENEILYAESAVMDDNGMKNGEIVLHCKKF